MTREKIREQAVEIKLGELRDLRERRLEVEKKIWELEKYYGELAKMMDKVKGEIRGLGGRVPVGSECGQSVMLGGVINGRRLSDERP